MRFLISTQVILYFKYPENLATRISAAVQNPVTSNFAIDEHGFPSKSKVTTTEEKFRMTQLETEYIHRKDLNILRVIRSKLEFHVFPFCTPFSSAVYRAPTLALNIGFLLNFQFLKKGGGFRGSEKTV